MYRLFLFGVRIDSLGDLLDTLYMIGDGDQEVSNARTVVEKNSPELGCFAAYELYLTNRFGFPVREESGSVRFCD